MRVGKDFECLVLNVMAPEIVSSGELGKVKSVSASLCVPWQMQIAKPDDIRFNFDLGGGILMDMGCELTPR